MQIGAQLPGPKCKHITGAAVQVEVYKRVGLYMVQLGEQDGREVRVRGGHGGGDLGERECERVAERHLALTLAD